MIVLMLLLQRCQLLGDLFFKLEFSLFHCDDSAAEVEVKTH